MNIIINNIDSILVKKNYDTLFKICPEYGTSMSDLKLDVNLSYCDYELLNTILSNNIVFFKDEILQAIKYDTGFFGYDKKEFIKDILDSIPKEDIQKELRKRSLKEYGETKK